MYDRAPRNAARVSSSGVLQPYTIARDETLRKRHPDTRVGLVGQVTSRRQGDTIVLIQWAASKYNRFPRNNLDQLAL